MLINDEIEILNNKYRVISKNKNLHLVVDLKNDNNPNDILLLDVVESSDVVPKYKVVEDKTTIKKFIAFAIKSIRI